ncbi:MAG TPA: hypothetical protein VNO30_20945 [Kofleriaceae bacterium]|nr:hypothetical protein [Kofleriaceae bacterium]
MTLSYSRSRTYLAGTCLALLFAASAGCGLISSDVADFDLTLPDKSFSIDTEGWQVDQAQAQALFNTPCGTAPSICDTAAQMACDMNCSGTCTANRCELQLDVGLYREVNLVQEKPELKSINDQPVIKVTIDSVSYQVTANTLNVETPELKLYVAPMSVMDPKSPEAMEIAIIPPIGAGAVVPLTPVMFNAGGRERLISMMSTYKTPFNVIVGSTLTVSGGEPIPEGKLDAIVRIRAHAGL